MSAAHVIFPQRRSRLLSLLPALLFVCLSGASALLFDCAAATVDAGIANQAQAAPATTWEAQGRARAEQEKTWGRVALAVLAVLFVGAPYALYRILLGRVREVRLMRSRRHAGRGGPCWVGSTDVNGGLTAAYGPVRAGRIARGWGGW